MFWEICKRKMIWKFLKISVYSEGGMIRQGRLSDFDEALKLLMEFNT